MFLQAVKSSTQMRFNKSEVTCLAAQPSHKFEKEGVLFIREKQEGFFRKTESKFTIGCGGGGQGVSVLAFYYNDTSLNPAEAYSFVCKICV